MLNRIVAVALFGGAALALTQAPGSAVVINNCDYAVKLNNVPAGGEGGTEESKTLQKGDTYSQHFTGLMSSTGSQDGWSIKLVPATYTGNQIMQFEYTYQPLNPSTPDSIWFDISYVNGDPFNQNWKLTSNDITCDSILTHSAYNYDTDDANGMQKPCDKSADITLNLCGVGSTWSTTSSSSVQGLIPAIVSVATSAVEGIVSAIVEPSTSAAAVVVPTTTAAPVVVPTTTAVPVISTTAAPVVSNTAHTGRPVETDARGHFNFGQHNAVDSDSSVPTTFATQVSSPVSQSPVYKTFGATVTEIEVAWVTSFVTVDYPEATEVAPKKRHVHHAAHHEH